MKKTAFFLVSSFLISILFLNFLIQAEDKKADSWTYDGVTYKLPIPRDQVIIPPDLPKVYIVKERDTLWDLSGAYLKNPFFWPLIWEVNPQVHNPHLIFPGDELTFPGATAAKKEFKKPVISEKPLVKAEKPIVKQEKKEVKEELPVQEVYYSTYDLYDLFYASGFISEKKSGKDVVPLGKIISAPFDNGTITTKSRVYIDVPDCAMDECFKIIRLDEKIRHPKTNKVIGKMVKTLGYMNIVCNQGAYAEGLITKAYDEIQIGDKIIRCDENPIEFKKEPDFQQCYKIGSGLKGTIVKAANNFEIFSDLDMVFLDIGSTKGVKPGDYFAVVLKTGTKKIEIYKQIAQLVILRTRNNTSSAVITKSIIELKAGDLVELL
jgi:hypothetical protein